MIRLEKVGMMFGQGPADTIVALDNISLAVRSGDFITLIGSNGAGKTTLYNAIAGTSVPTSGRIFIRDERTGTERDITREAEFRRARYIGRIFQNPLLGTAGKMSLADNMMICYKKGYKGLGISLTKTMRERFREELRTHGKPAGRQHGTLFRRPAPGPDPAYDGNEQAQPSAPGRAYRRP